MYILDSHNHLLDEPEYAEKLLVTMDRLGFAAICLSGLGIGGYDPDAQAAKGLSSLAPTNEDVAALIDRHPDRIIGYAALTLGRDGPETVRYWRKRGFLGVKFTRPLLPYNHDDCFPVYAEAARLNMPALFHTGFVLRTPQDAADDVDTDRMRPVLLDRVARRFQAWPIVLAHMGIPWFAECSEMVRFHPNVHVDLSCGDKGWRERVPADFFRRHFHWPGAYRKIVFGTDLHYNFMEKSFRHQVDIFRRHRLCEDDRKAVMGETVRGWLRRAALYPADEACLEIIARNAEEVRLAQESGADRIELLADPAAGGVTPPEDTLREVAAVARIPVMAMVRPRGGGFTCSDGEMAAMRRTLALLRELSLTRQTMARFGAVLGVRDAGGRLDTARMGELAAAGEGLELVCHLAFEGVPGDPQSRKDAALALADMGFRRILSTGGPADGNDVPALKTLNAAVGGRITIMPGVNIAPADVAELAADGFIQQHLGRGVRKNGDPDGELLPGAIRAAARNLAAYSNSR
jgi:copper homeostasis protein CutC/predicted TIM-barrel fold metal-dependent hydrolase